ncbi:MAG: AraC family transcriptional regulator [Bacteroidota bacterium]
MLQLPQALLNPAHRQIHLTGVTILESCLYDEELADVAYLTEHELIYLLSGELIVTMGQERLTIQAGEAILARRGTYFQFQKVVDHTARKYESILFFIQPAFVTDFLRRYDLNVDFRAAKLRSAAKISHSPLLRGFMYSLVPYFGSELVGKRALLRLKTFELLFQLVNHNPSLLPYLTQLNERPAVDLVHVMEQHFTRNLAIKEFALIAGRSVSSFQRDFKKIFADTPARWLKRRRLQLAKKLLTTTSQRPTDIYLDVGFEDYAHFSKAFKAEFGLSPQQCKMNLSAI